MTRPLSTSEVVARVLAGRPAQPTPAELETCRAPGCTSTCEAPGSYDGFCATCAKSRLRDGAWETMRLDTELGSDAEQQE